MAVNAMAFPILPDKLGVWREYNDQVTGPRRTEFEDMMKRHGFNWWLVWRQQTPQGNMLVVFQEGQGAGAGVAGIAASDHPFDVWLKGQVREITGLDLSQPPPGPPPELVLEVNL